MAAILLIAATSVLLALQPQSGCVQNASDQGRLDSQTNGEQAVNVKAYGAVGDGVTNVSHFGFGYLDRTPQTSVLSDVHLRGAGRAATTGEWQTAR